jgi:O-antigen/teichoic acid export membrane protein
MMAQLAVPIRRLPGFLDRIRSDSLVRNSLYIMATTVVTAGLGYVFWAVAAHDFTRQEIGIGSAIISLCSTASLLVYLGPSAMLIERLPARERSEEWTRVLYRVCLATAAVTAAATAAALPVLLVSKDYRSFFTAVAPIIIAVVGAAAWTLVNLLGAAFIAARRAGRLLSIQTLISAAKLLLILPLATAGVGAAGVVDAWVASAIIGIGVGVVWLVPGMRLGHRPGQHPHVAHRRQRRRLRRAESAALRSGPDAPRRARRLRAAGRSGAEYARRLLGQHLTSVGGAVTPLVLPVLVVIRLGDTANAYFYITEMMCGIFFMVSPSVAAATFAEGVQAHADLRSVVVKALRVIAVMLVPPMIVMIIGGRLILGLYGASYSAAGYGLLVLLAVAAVPDAVSNVAVSICRVTQRLAYSSLINLGILVVTLLGAWILMPTLGIAGVGVAWLAAQTLGAIASLPAYAGIRKQVTV